MGGEGWKVGGVYAYYGVLERVGWKLVYVNVVWIHIECLWPLKIRWLFVCDTKTVSIEYINGARP